MIDAETTYDPVPPTFPRYVRIAGHWVSAYKIFLCIGVHCGILVSAAVAARSGLSPLRLGVWLLTFALVGLAGARIYHLAIHFEAYHATGLALKARHPREGGWSVLGGLVIVPWSLLFDSIAGLPTERFWDYMVIAIAIGGAWIRFGCVCNGCCIGRESTHWLARRQHDVHLVYRRRLPVQWLEIAWWIAAVAGLIWFWPQHLPAGCYALGVLAWYGLGRIWLEPLRARVSMVWGVPINQLVAALLAVVAGGLLWHAL